MATQLIPMQIPAQASGASVQVVQPTVNFRWIERHFPRPEDQREYAQEACVVAVTEAIGSAMDSAKLTRAEIAEKLGKNRSYVSRVLNGAHNMTLRTLGDMLWACDLEVRDLDVMPLGVIEVSAEDAMAWQLYDLTDGQGRPTPDPMARGSPLRALPLHQWLSWSTAFPAN